jgi:hypothetical protein
MPQSLYATTAVLVLFASLPVTAQQPGGAVSVPRAIGGRAVPRILPGTRPNVFGAIQGNALNSTNGALSNATVRLRNARFGQILDTQGTDQSGLFAFRTVEPGSYIVEIMGQDQYSVLGASQILNVGPGEAVSAVVKLPFKVPPFAGILGNTTASAAAVTSQAASAGVLAAQASGAATCDSLQ